MRKYLVQFFLFFSLISFISVHSTTTVNAAGTRPEGTECVIDGIVDNTKCEAGLICNPDHPDAPIGVPFADDFGICTKPSGAALNCACMEEGVAGSGKNGFKCSTDTDPQAIRNSNAQIEYCDGQTTACMPSDGGVDAGTVKGDTYANNALKGIICEKPRTKALCKCVGTGASGENNFECTKEGTAEKATGFCKSGIAKCVNATDPNKITDSNTVWKFEGFLKNDATIFNDGYLITGIRCDTDRTRIYPTLPPPPPPPCAQPISKEGNCPEFATAVGNLKTVPEGFISSLFAVLLSVSGGIALLLIMKAGYQMLVSQGKPEAINNARDQLVAAIVGLIFLILSFVILTVIGFDILQIPGFGA